MDATTETLSVDDSLSTFVTLMLARHRTAFPVVDDGSVVGLVRLEDLRTVPRDAYELVRIGDVMGDPPIRVTAAADAFETLTELGQQGTDYALVEAEGHVVGTVSRESFLAAIEIQQGLWRAT
jgi:CBS domain-containing protein